MVGWQNCFYELPFALKTSAMITSLCLSLHLFVNFVFLHLWPSWLPESTNPTVLCSCISYQGLNKFWLDCEAFNFRNVCSFCCATFALRSGGRSFPVLIKLSPHIASLRLYLPWSMLSRNTTMNKWCSLQSLAKATSSKGFRMKQDQPTLSAVPCRS